MPLLKLVSRYLHSVFFFSVCCVIVQELEQDLRVKNKELRELEYEHDKQMRDKEREIKEMQIDIEKLIRMIDRQKKKLKVSVIDVYLFLDFGHF